jgi:CBS domain-containing protein
MATAVQAIPSEAPLSRAAEIKCADRIHRLVVLDDQSILTGILTTLDVVAALLSAIDEVSEAVSSRESNRVR